MVNIIKQCQNLSSFIYFRADVPRPGLAKMRMIRLTDMMKCPITNTNFKEMVECLRKVDAKKITEAIYDFYVSFILNFFSKRFSINFEFENI